MIFETFVTNSFTYTIHLSYQKPQPPTSGWSPVGIRIRPFVSWRLCHLQTYTPSRPSNDTVGTHQNRSRAWLHQCTATTCAAWTADRNWLTPNVAVLLTSICVGVSYLLLKLKTFEIIIIILIYSKKSLRTKHT